MLQFDGFVKFLFAFCFYYNIIVIYKLIVYTTKGEKTC